MPPVEKPTNETVDPLDVLFETVASEIDTPKESSYGASLHDIMQEAQGEEKLSATQGEKPVSEPKVEPKDEGDKPKADEKLAEQDKPLKARKAKNIVPSPPAPVEAQQPANEPAKVAADDDESGFLPEEQEQLKLARDAERLLPDRYKGYGERMKKYLKDHASFLAEASQKDPGAVFDEDNAEYQAWLKKNAVHFTPSEREALITARIREEVRRENDDKFAELQDDLFRRDEEPKIASRGRSFFDELTKTQIPSEIRKAMETKGDSAKAEYALEFNIADRVFQTAASDIEELVRISTINPRTGRALKQVDPNNEQHVRLDRLVKVVCEDFERDGGAARMKDGKRFVTRAQFFRYSPEQRNQVWTFEIPDIIERAKTYAGKAVAMAIKARHDELTALGFRRTPAAAPSAPTEHQSAPAMPRPSAVPPNAAVAPATIDEDMIGQSLFGE